MALTAIQTFHAQSDLAAGVRAGAILSGAGLVGVVASGPARLALLPFAGGAGHTVDLPVESPQEVALLSRDVAVVRAADGHLWALSGLDGEVRAKSIARDVRALCMRPSGESAIALHQDGSAGAITLSRQEVAVRPFTVRGGAIRACDVGDNVTYALVEGEGGGQFRIHPGATPELGTSARTVLPAEARELEHVRGGPALSVVWKRGSSSLCAITGGQGKPTARMVEVEGKPADVAVLEDVLFVAFADGRVALYGPEALAQGSGPMTPLHTTVLSTRGKPRIALALTVKGSAALWIGTTAGEVLRAPLARDGAPVEEPPKPAPREDLRAELAATRQALGETEAAREAESMRARALEEERAAAVAAGEQALAALRAEHEATLAALHAEGAQALEAQKASAAQAWQEQVASHAAAIEALTAARDTREKDLSAAGEKALAALRAEHETALTALRTETAEVLEAQKAFAARVVDAQDTEHAAAIAALTAERDAARADLATARADLATARADVDAARTEAATVTARLSAAEQGAAEKSRALDAREAEIEALRAHLADEQAKLDRDFVKWGDTTISLEKARGALGSMLTRAEGLFGKRPRE